MLADIIPSISAGDITALAEFGLFIVTAILVYLTWKNVHETTKLVETQINPFVYIEAEWEKRSSSQLPPRLLVFIKNSGGGIARDIKFVNVEDDFPVRLRATQQLNGIQQLHSSKSRS